ncbi:MAG: type IV-A pilus assembly ATPase PilB, partial [Thiomargarita sp.]|nr:type IV-A pilus assembly ATPase PilB [Thiomargarita sp.]
LSGLPLRLVKENLLPTEIAEEALLNKKVSFVSYIVQNRHMNGDKLALIAAQEFGIPFVDIGSIELNEDLIKGKKDDKEKLDPKFYEDNKAIPIFSRGNRIFVAISDPSSKIDRDALDLIKFKTGMNTDPVIAEDNKLLKVVERALEFFGDDMDLEGDLEGELSFGEDETEEEEEVVDLAEEAPIVIFVNKMLLKAYKMGASDLHFEPYEKYYRVRFRVDGMLRSVANPPITVARKLAARIKVMARLDVSERRVPQDGRIKINISKNKSIDLRVSTCPILYGEKIVMRILDSSAANLNIDILGYEENDEEPMKNQKQLYLDALSNPYGMVLVTGPTGSGKTVSLYTGINILNQEGVNISTAEDPVEINLPGVNQVQIDEKTGMTFAKALKAFLRQDPDIILVGEIRDLETGGIAIKAATTGHMVMSTLHTNDAPQTLTRMIDMGIAPFAIASAVNLIMAQRLCRRLCSCKIEQDIPKEALLIEGFTEEEIDNPDFRLYTPRTGGCEKCNNLGYKGRVGVYQVMPLSDIMKRFIMEGKNAITIADQARKEGIPDLRFSGLKKAKDGMTSLEEVNRVVSKE